MTKPRLTIVTATAGAEKSGDCFQSWYAHAAMDRALVMVRQNDDGPSMPLRSKDVLASVLVPNYLGPVPAFKLGVDLALQITSPDGIIACLHDDLLIEEASWDAKVMAFFNLHPDVGLLGFGGGTGLGSDDIYKAPYNPHQLARQDFVSNMRDAEAHGRRVTVPTRVACLDGFSQIGRVAYWKGWPCSVREGIDRTGPLTNLEKNRVVHHAYDAYLGAFASVMGWQVYMLPIACHHYGGQTAVGDQGYQKWAGEQREAGDQTFWTESHKQVYELLRGVLPIRV